MRELLSMWKGPLLVGSTPGEQIARIIGDAAGRHQVTVDAIKSDSRYTNVVNARQEAMYRLRGLLRADGRPRLSFERIGEIMGRDHSTVQHGIHAHAKRAILPSQGASSPQIEHQTCESDVDVQSQVAGIKIS